MNNSISWKEFFMGLAELAAKRSKDPKTKVGACIIEPTKNNIISIGYNGLPRGMVDTEEIWQDSSDGNDKKHLFCVHAEANAILNANSKVDGTTLYITEFPCNECAKLIIQSGIKKVIYKDDKFLHKVSAAATLEMFKAANVEIIDWRYTL